LGHDVTCVDVDERRVRCLQSGRVPFYEPWVQDMFEMVTPRLEFTLDPARAIPDAEVIFITVGTPSSCDGQPDLSQVRCAARQIGAHLANDFTVVVNKSTVPIGCSNWVSSVVREAFVARNGKRPPSARFAVVSNPEFLREGRALHDSLYPDRIVLGCEESRSLDVMSSLYRPLLEQAFVPPPFLPRPPELNRVPLVTTDMQSAELVKYAANAFLSLKISFINEIAGLSERVGGDIGQVSKALGLDRRIGEGFLDAGIGWGGSCFGKDTAALLAMAGEYRVPLPIVSASREVNYRQRERVVERLQAALKILKGRTIGLLGVTFKAETDDTRDSPALDIARSLVARGAWVRAHDPVALPKAAAELEEIGVTCCHTASAVCEDADALVLATDWPEYRDWPWAELAASMHRPLLVDGRNCLDEKKLADSGFHYLAIGR
jgi:UDPglucose 6-dehydrogenase